MCIVTISKQISPRRIPLDQHGPLLAGWLAISGKVIINKIIQQRMRMAAAAAVTKANGHYDDRRNWGENNIKAVSNKNESKLNIALFRCGWPVVR